MGLFPAAPSLNAEITAWKRGYRRVAGLDEAGRGPLAGPVVSGIAILDPPRAAPWWSDLRDSKQIEADERDRLYDLITSECEHAAGAASHEEIDELGLIAATKLSMERAIAALSTPPDMILIDAVCLPEWRHRSVIHGDAVVASIAAGSIVAKVTRDRMMQAYHPEFPAYAFDSNKGYSTPEHKRAIDEHGVCAIHRRLFAPVRAALEARGLPVPVTHAAIVP